MGPASRKRSLADVQHTHATVPMEYNDRDYFRDVLQLEAGLTEAAFDSRLVREAEALGITISRPASPANNDQNVAHHSVSHSAVTVGSHHARTFSSGSQGSDSTGMTSTSSNEHSDNASRPQTKRRSIARRSFSFSEYARYLAHAEAQDNNALRAFVYPPVLPEPAPSLFSVSTRRSMKSIKSLKKGIQSRLRLRRNYASQDDLK